jgi:hypothetical protein
VIQFKGEHVSWTGLAKEFLVKGTHCFGGHDCQGEVFEGRPEHFVGGLYSAAEDGNARPRVGGEDGQFQGQFQACLITGGTEVSALG